MADLERTDSGSSRDLVATLRRAAAWLYEDDPEFVEGGCADVSATLRELARRLGHGSRVRFASGLCGERDGTFPHAWLVVDGRIFDPVAHATHGVKDRWMRSKYREGPEGDVILGLSLADESDRDTNETLNWRVGDVIEGLGLEATEPPLPEADRNPSRNGDDEDLRSLRRIPLEDLDEEQAARLRYLVERAEGQKGLEELLGDAAGLGGPVVESLRRRISEGLPPLPVVFRAWETRSEARRRRRAGEGPRLFVGHPSGPPYAYNMDQAEEALRRAGARIARRSNMNGWANQPEVVVFSGLDEHLAGEALGAAGIAYGWIGEKDWGGDATRPSKPDIEAIFPTKPGDDHGDLCEMFSDAEGWTTGTPRLNERTRPAEPEEYAKTLETLGKELDGRRLKVYSRIRHEFDRERRDEARRRRELRRDGP